MKSNNKIVLSRDQLQHLYIEENLSSNEIAHRYGCHGLTVRARLREYEIPIKTRGWHKLVRCVPDTILKSWPSPNLAYVVGLIASDGNLQRQNNCVQLVSTDQELVDLCAAALGLDTRKIISWNQPSRKTAFMLQVCDYAFREFLESRGLTPNKSLSIGPLGIPDSVFAHFLRGELDGDGSWFLAKGWRGVPYLVGAFRSASQPFLEWLQQTIARLTGIEGCLQHRKLVYNGKKAEALGNWIYPASTLPCLQRKRDIWRNWMAGR
jgi:hypothetical protein